MRPATFATLSGDLDLAVERGDTDEAIRLADQIDRMEPPRFSLVLSALWYAQHGLWVFPLQPLCKKPWPGSHGLDDASTDPDRIHAWWDQTPEANIGIATGHVVDVIDFDGADAHSAWSRQFQADEVADVEAAPPGTHWWDPEEPATGQAAWDRAETHVLGTVTTPRPGGLHVYVPASGRGNRAGMLPGVDYRGIGGYVVAPPSVLDQRDDQHPGTYRWLRPLDWS